MTIIDEAWKLRSLADRMETHVVARGGQSHNHDTGEIYVPNGAWAMMLEASKTIRQLLDVVAEKEIEVERLRAAAERCKRAVDFAEKVRASTDDEKLAVGDDHWIGMEHACREAATALVGDK